MGAGFKVAGRVTWREEKGLLLSFFDAPFFIVFLVFLFFYQRYPRFDTVVFSSGFGKQKRGKEEKR